MKRTAGAGLYVTSEKHAAIMPRKHRPDLATTGTIVFPGRSGNARSFLGAGFSQIATAVGDQIPTASFDFGGVSTWGNVLASETRAAQALTFAVSALGFRSDRLLLICSSMGALNGLNFARVDPTRIAAIALHVPVVNLRAFYAQNRGTWATEILAAHGGVDAQLDARNPSAWTAELADIPMKAWYSTDDPLAVPEDIAAFAAAHGNCELRSMGAAGHTPTVPGSEVLDFLAPYA